MDYLDFDIAVEAGTSGTYQVSVVQSPAGEAHGEMTFPYDRLALKNKIQALQIALLRSGGSRRAGPSAEDKSVEELGSDLFASLFKGEIGSRLDVSRSIAQNDGKGVRIKLRIAAPELAGLPWEYLYDAAGGDYLALGISTPVIRYLPIAKPIQPLEVTPPLRILAMTAGPSDLGKLDADRERQRLDVALEKVRQKGLVEVEWVPGESWEDLQQALWDGPWHIFHFVGHGGYSDQLKTGVIYLTGEDGKAHELSAKDLAVLLGDHEPLRLALLNSCETAQGAQTDIFSSTAAALVRRGTPAVVAMQFEITDDAAIQFSRVFYTAIARGMPVDSAVAEARKSVALQVTNTYEWGTPVLFMRSPNGTLFNIPKSALAAAPPLDAAAATIVAGAATHTPTADGSADAAGGPEAAGDFADSSAGGRDGAAALAALGGAAASPGTAASPAAAASSPPATAAFASGGTALYGGQAPPPPAIPSDVGGFRVWWDANKVQLRKVAIAGLIVVVAVALLYWLVRALGPGPSGSASPVITLGASSLATSSPLSSQSPEPGSSLSTAEPTPFSGTAPPSFSLDIRVEPTSARIGDMVTIHLTDFPRNAPVVIQWESGDVITRGDTDANGAFDSDPVVVQRARAGLKSIYAYAYKDLSNQLVDHIFYDVLATPASPTPPITPSPFGPAITLPPSATPTLPPLTGDAVRIVSAEPDTATTLRSDVSSTFTFTIQYSLESVSQARLYVSIGELAFAADCSGDPSLVVAEYVLIDSGVGETSVTVTWPGSPDAEGFVAPVPSLWQSDFSSRIVYFGADQNYCYRYAP